jgi:hypothetical protein
LLFLGAKETFCAETKLAKANLVYSANSCSTFENPVNARTEEIIDRFQKSWDKTIEFYEWLLE